MRESDTKAMLKSVRSGSLWHFHYGVNLPSLGLGFPMFTAANGAGGGRAFTQIPIRRGDYGLANCGYLEAFRTQHVVAACGHIAMRVNSG